MIALSSIHCTGIYSRRLLFLENQFLYFLQNARIAENIIEHGIVREEERIVALALLEHANRIRNGELLLPLFKDLRDELLR